MRARHIAIAAGVVVLLGALIWFALPKRTASDSLSPPSAATDIRAARSDAPPRRLEVKPDPTPTSPERRKSTPGGIAIIDAAERVELAKAIRGAREARENGASAAAPASPQPAAATAQPPEGEPLHRDHIRAQIAEIEPLLEECYTLELQNAPGLEGTLHMRFTIEGEPGVGGVVSESSVLGGELAPSKELTTCVRETLYTLKLPPPEEGGEVVVHYPFVFESN